MQSNYLLFIRSPTHCLMWGTGNEVKSKSKLILSICYSVSGIQRCRTEMNDSILIDPNQFWLLNWYLDNSIQPKNSFSISIVTVPVKSEHDFKMK